MSDRTDRIEAGVFYSWAARLKSGEVIKELDKFGNLRKLNTIPEDELDEWWAVSIHDESDEPKPLYKFRIPEGGKYIWYHETLGILNLSEEVPVPRDYETRTVCGVESEKYKVYAILNDGTAEIVLEEK
jgi:hypothetical protein